MGRVLRCPFCFEVFTSYKQFKEHLRLHVDEYRCVYCDRKFSSTHGLLQHCIAILQAYRNHNSFPAAAKIHAAIFYALCRYTSRFKRIALRILQEEVP